MAPFGTLTAQPEVDLASGEVSAAPNRTPVGRALVAMRPAQSAAGGFAHRTDARTAAPFLTHLLATAQGVPQTRACRRAEPARAITAYADRMHAPPTVGRAIHESR